LWPGEKKENNWYELSMNYNSIPYQSNMAIIVTSYVGHLKWLKATLTNYRLSGKFVICAYDLPFYAWSGAAGRDLDSMFPHAGIFLLAHSWVFKHLTYDCDKRNGWFWDVRYAHGIVKQFSNFKYIFCTNGDCILEKPDGLDEIVDILGDGDVMSDASTFDGVNSGNIHTCSVMYKIDAFNAIFDNIAEKMRIPVIGSRSPETCLREAINECGLKEVLAPKQPMYPDEPYQNQVDHYHSFNQDCTWKEVLGFRNLGAEYNTGLQEQLELPPREYFDLYRDGIYLNNMEKSTLYHYYKTGDRRWLYKAWSEQEGSWYNRLYYPLEHYGKEPIYEKK